METLTGILTVKDGNEIEMLEIHDGTREKLGGAPIAFLWALQSKFHDRYGRWPGEVAEWRWLPIPEDDPQHPFRHNQTKESTHE